MTSQKMIRFLNSIGIDNVDDYDIFFEMVGKDPYNNKRVIFTIRKETPWSLKPLLDFKKGMESLKYLYDLRFAYSETPYFNDVRSLLEDYFKEINGNSPMFSIEEGENERMVAVFSDRNPDGYEEKFIKESNELLKFISYSFSLVAKRVDTPVKEPEPVVEEKVEETSIPEEVIQEEEVAENVVEETPSFDEDAFKDDIEEYQKGLREAEMRDIEASRYEKRALANQRQTYKGNYKRYDHIQDLFRLNGGNIEIQGEVFGIGKNEAKPNKNGKLFLRFSLGDWTNAIVCRAVEGGSITEATFEGLKDGAYVTVQGAMTFDLFSGSNERQIRVHSIEKATRPMREDKAPKKRVELHLHTKMSQMDGLGEPADYIKTAASWGMPAIAITDHGVVQAFPEAEAANNALKDKKLKLLYGVEFYMFDWPRPVFGNLSKTPLNNAKYCVFDFETTGLSHTYDRPIEFGAVIIENGVVSSKTLDLFIDPEIEIGEEARRINHITDEDLKGAPKMKDAIKTINEFIGDAILVSHNAPFDASFLNMMRHEAGLGDFENPIIDTLAISQILYPDAASVNEGRLAHRLGVEIDESGSFHRANFDAEVLAKMWLIMLPEVIRQLGGYQNTTHEDLASLEVPKNQNFYRHMKTYHVCTIAKDKRGLKDIYRLVSESETVYLSPQGGIRPALPKIPRDVLMQNRENLLLGSACFNGLVFEKAMNETQAELEEEMAFYDYIEIQPKENYRYLINAGYIDEAKLDDILKRIVATADKLGKKVVATGDCHYVNPEEKITRDIYIAAEGLGHSKHPLNLERRGKFENPDQHLRTTDEMLDCFRGFLSEEKCQEIVIDNTNWVADQCIADATIVYEDLHAPDANLPGSKEKLRELCYETLHKTYGENPHPDLVERLEKELNGIISNGYSVTYWIAHLLVKKATEDGYFIGSRGSVGSSFAAHMADITEVNPLEPHYLCPECKHFEWAKDDPSLAHYRSGFDLPKKACPHCGHDMKRDGQSIPFEVFLGFKAEKVPDIDLNFPADYQSIGHAFTRTLLSTPEENEKIERGEFVSSPHVIRAGTVAGAEEKNAMGYVKRYYENVLGHAVTNEERAFANYLGFKCCGVKRTTGQHPGGIVVIPANMDVFDFTPYQHPADDPEADWLTTHFEFKSMHDGVLKLDELGHVDPVTLRMQCLLTGIDIRKINEVIPMDDPDVLSLFRSPNALKLRKNPLNLKTGATGLPEFGTNFVQGILIEANPTSFNDLLIISGLSHGTNVWNGNAQDLVKSGRTLSDVIGCRDDIMDYLIKMGMDSSLAFKCMEDVRKNKFRAKEDAYVPAMKECHVPEWYIDSCRKIRYLFPRAHATAYVIGAVRAAWFKLYHPLEFYATYFTARCDHFDIKAMKNGLSGIMDAINAIRNKPMEEKKDTDDDYLKSLISAAELCDRGYTIENISLMESDSVNWVINKERKSLIPPFTAIANFASGMAEGIVEARKKGEFISKDDIVDRVKKTLNVEESKKQKRDVYYSLGSKAIETLDEYGVLEGLSETNQMSLFDFTF